MTNEFNPVEIRDAIMAGAKAIAEALKPAMDALNESFGNLYYLIEEEAAKHGMTVDEWLATMGPVVKASQAQEEARIEGLFEVNGVQFVRIRQSRREE